MDNDGFKERFRAAMYAMKKRAAILEMNRYVYARYRYNFPYIKNPEEHVIPLYTG